ncbi:hypothetical protein L1887_58801 [Cichorium endivia]|nr:hypothetical protein L1887_58801 [Cichorium endivia]
MAALANRPEQQQPFGRSGRQLSEPKEEEWFCLNCQVHAESGRTGGQEAEQEEANRRTSLAKPVKSEKQNGHHDAQGKKRNKDAQKNEDKKLQKAKGQKEGWSAIRRCVRRGGILLSNVLEERRRQSDGLL